MTKPDTLAGPLAWRNWKRHIAKASANGGFEYTLYTDAGIDNDATTGPYEWIDTFAGSSVPIVGEAAPAVVLRVAVHLTDEEFASVDFERPDTKDYLAGDMGDELASLLSLALHRRIRSGGMTRRFDGNDGINAPGRPFSRGIEFPGSADLTPDDLRCCPALPTA